MDNPNITMEEYIRLEEEKSRRRGKVYNWETATYGKIWDNEDVHDLGSVETEFPAIIFNDMLTSEAALSCEPMVSSLNDEIDFRISFDESNDEDCTLIPQPLSYAVASNDLWLWRNTGTKAEEEYGYQRNGGLLIPVTSFFLKGDEDPSPSCRPTKVEVPKELPIVSMLNQKNFQRDNSVSNQSAPNFDQYFELNELKASFGVKSSTSASESQPSGNTKKDKIQQTPSSTQKNKHSKLNANSELLCVKCNGCMLSDNHDLCVLDFINDVNARAKSKSVKKSSKRKVWKPTGKVFTNIGYTWRPTGRTFTIVGNVCPLTRITTTAEVPLRKPTALETDTPKPVVTLVYLRKTRKSKTNVPVSKPKIIKSISAKIRGPINLGDP
ncbi:hypothetical protein Tco_0003796 [Tanacetum coccineum]